MGQALHPIGVFSLPYIHCGQARQVGADQPRAYPQADAGFERRRAQPKGPVIRPVAGEGGDARGRLLLQAGEQHLRRYQADARLAALGVPLAHQAGQPGVGRVVVVMVRAVGGGEENKIVGVIGGQGLDVLGDARRHGFRLVQMGVGDLAE